MPNAFDKFVVWVAFAITGGVLSMVAALGVVAWKVVIQ